MTDLEIKKMENDKSNICIGVDGYTYRQDFINSVGNKYRTDIDTA